MALAVACGLFFSGCELDTGENFFFFFFVITEVEVPDSFVLNESYNLEVTFSRPDSCTFFHDFDVFARENGTITVVAIGSVLTEEDCNPTQESLSGIVTLPINYQVPFYTLRFYAGEDGEGNPQFLEYTVPVVDGSNQ